GSCSESTARASREIDQHEPLAPCHRHVSSSPAGIGLPCQWTPCARQDKIRALPMTEMKKLLPHGLPFAPVKVGVLIDIDMGSTGMAGICRTGARSDAPARRSGRSWVAHRTTLHAL